MLIRFVSGNKYKIAEARKILGISGVKVIALQRKIEELQTTDTRRLVHDKVLKAFRGSGHPLFVEHTGLYLEHLKGFPGGLTQIFWDSLKANKFSSLFGRHAPVNRVVAKTYVAYCDGARIHDFEGEIRGSIVSRPRGSTSFQWDCVFQPDGYKQTFAEMKSQKNEISMRRIALDKLARYLGRR